MDHFGIGAAMVSLVRTYTQSARRSGRTTSLVESVKDGDRIVFTEAREAERVKRLCLERGVTVECVVVSPRDPSFMMQSGTSQGRTIFDHTFVEMFYENVIERASRELDHLERELSGYGEAHRETRRRAEEIAKWRR